jgi:hypothetical protein
MRHRREHRQLCDLELNSQFGDITSFVQYGSTGEPDPTRAASPNTASTEESYPTTEGSFPLPTTFPPPSAGPPGIFLINLAVLAAATRLRIDPWNETTGYIQFIALHHWHPSFGIVFPDFLRLVHTELREGILHHREASVDPSNPLNIQVGPPSNQPASPSEETKQ